MNESLTTDICVQRAAAQGLWQVVLCTRQQPGQILGTFPTFSGAAEFAIQERDRRQADKQSVSAIHFPDDCPCYRSGGCGDKTQA